MKRHFVFRKVVSVQMLSTRYNRPGEGSNLFHLECGHTAVAKASAGSPRRKHCRECAQDSGRPLVGGMVYDP